MSLEQELKFKIAGPAEFERVLLALGPPQAVLEQRNHYFASPSKDWALRVRDEDGEFELTLKLGRRQSQGYFEALEINCDLNQAQVAELLEAGAWSEELWELPPLQRLRTEFGVGQLALLGSLHNRRHRCDQGGWVGELDITTFPDGHVDYELEVETSQVELVQQALQPLAELLSEQTQTKFRRFLTHQIQAAP